MTSSRLAANNGRYLHAVHGDRDCFEHCCFFKWKIGGQRIHDAIRDDDVLSKCAVTTIVPLGDADHFTVIAEIDLAVFAVRALATVNGGVECDAIALGKPGDALANSFNRSSGFVSHYDGRNAPAG